ncbi:putative ORFan [Tupanvirus deep ocean]|uniref:ORFan n=2 Tax=Tupanvirus TaxID=2094720 RepID=A0AC62AAF2_9VIRU|nr:putative ORFan [Tupanvirus deep ocean]QKU34598.1 putative ORFan [Tupanvirus deep ocean]
MSATCHINVNDTIVSFCQGNSFKNYVRQAINDEMFWRDLFTNMNLNNNIDNRLTSKLPDQVKRELERILPDMMRTRYLDYIVNQFPNQVAKEINNQFPSYLNNNYQMQQILDTHKSSLKQQLESTVRDILDRISNDPKYQEVVQAHLQAIDYNGTQKIKEISDNADSQLKNIRNDFNQELYRMKNEVNSNLSNLSSQLSELQNIKNEISNIKDKQRDDINKIHWLYGGAIAVITIALSLFTLTK